MYNILINNVKNSYDYEELIKIFLPPDSFCILTERPPGDIGVSQLSYLFPNQIPVISFNEKLSNDKNEIKREIYRTLSELTGKKPPWGILTGVRPVKLTGEIAAKGYDLKKTLTEDYLVSEEKTSLLIETYNYQQEILGAPEPDSIGMYIGIPFCPTRCLYCSFTSNQKPKEEIDRYLESLKKEIEYVGKRMKDTGIYPESIYIGGGTPTTLDEAQLDDLLTTVFINIDTDKLKEFTVEAGRPDTITKEKLEVIKSHGVKRISINPQTMNQETLDLIGRLHKPQDITDAFRIRNEAGIEDVNCDLITGLPKETIKDFKYTLDEIFKLDPENITIHTLAVKRASRLIEEDPTYHYRQGEIVKEMLDYADKELRKREYRPYYLYRQKHMAGSFENVGWCKKDTLCIYNIRIMEEKQSILALGAGGISKIYYPSENRLERIPNVSNYEIYIERLDEMIERKELNFFKEVEKCR